MGDLVPNSTAFFVGSDGAIHTPRTPDVYKIITGAVINPEATVWTPAAGKKFRLLGFYLVSGAAAGSILFKDGTGGTTIFSVPNNGVTAGQYVALPGIGILSATANNVLTATGSGASQTITGTIFGTEE